ncbi:hypothetical protein KHC33_14065 [Methanospirillum sp. J.3.6.1-F.2.7.3]|uniref:Uncharacterized protein n=1 Tax=Methanospirillum purgamenti TaxID=2834276 RepID=A0A8E7AZR9_9EURY|nr:MULTISPECIES: hypothetical protein [Methanospirillum]MDX8551295.1 hypothetical protein [Methanospirillum hungatei]QVV88433.1 hypothetical protein KHC33_14065 [Methanospirillum sp. J.3.6.1-F.2.7.3]
MTSRIKQFEKFDRYSENIRSLSQPRVNIGRIRKIDEYALIQIDTLEKAFTRKCFKVDNLKGIFQFSIPSSVNKDFRDIENLSIEWILENESEKRIFESKLIHDISSSEEDPNLISLAEFYIHSNDPELFYKLNNLITNSDIFDNNAKILVSSSSILGYLFSIAVTRKKRTTPDGILEYILEEDSGGIKLLYDYVITKTGNEIITSNSIYIGTSMDVIVSKLKNTNYYFDDPTFAEKVSNLIHNQVSNKDVYALLDKFKKELDIELSDNDTWELIAFINQSTIKINESNYLYFLPNALFEIRNNGKSYIPITGATITKSEFSLTYYEEEEAYATISQENIQCAAMLFYVMTLGDELGIFNVVSMMATNHLVQGSLDIRNKDLLNDFQLYAYNDKFRDLITKNLHSKSDPQERMMFYKMVFNQGSGEPMEGMSVNEEFLPLWQALIYECLLFLDKADQSTNPYQYISKNGIIQAIEDLQYNLSNYCIGLVKVFTPMFKKELDFIIEQFLNNQSLKEQVGLSGSSMWMVLENLYKTQENVRMSSYKPIAANLLRNKAKVGHRILELIGQFTPSSFYQDQFFSDFITTVDAYNKVNSKIEKIRNGSSTIVNPADRLLAARNYYPNPEKTPLGDEWNF